MKGVGQISEINSHRIYLLNIPITESFTVGTLYIETEMSDIMVTRGTIQHTLEYC